MEDRAPPLQLPQVSPVSSPNSNVSPVPVPPWLLCREALTSRATVGLLMGPARWCRHSAPSVTDQKLACVAFPRCGPQMPSCKRGPQPHQGIPSPWPAGLASAVYLGTVVVTVGLGAGRFFKRTAPRLGDRPQPWRSLAQPLASCLI